jgi:hypothetical protein
MSDGTTHPGLARNATFRRRLAKGKKLFQMIMKD